MSNPPPISSLLVAAVFGLTPLPAHAAAAFVQAGTGSIDDTVAPDVSTMLATTAGNSLIVAVSWDAAGAPTAAASDSQSNAGWVACTARQGPYTYNQYHQIFFLPRIASASASHTITVTFSVPTGWRRLIVHEVGGLDSTATNCDQSAINFGMGTSLAAGPILPVADGEYVFATAMNMSNGTQRFSPNGAFTERATVLPGSGEMQTQDLVQGAAAAVTAGWTYSASGEYTVQIASFKAAGPVMRQKVRGCIGYACGGNPDEQFSVSLPMPTLQGNTVIAFVYWTTYGERAAAMTDNQGNAWFSVPAALHPSETSAGQFLYAPGIRGGPLTASVSLGACFDHAVGIALLEYSGLAPQGTLDVSAARSAPVSTADASTPSITTSSPDELLVAGFNNVLGVGTIQPGAGWTSQLTEFPFYMLVEDRLARSAGTYAGTALMPRADQGWVATIAAFRTVSDGGPTGTPVGGADAGSTLVVQRHRSLDTSGVASVSATFPAPTTAGNRLVAFGYWEGTSSAQVSDTAGQVWSAVAPAQKPAVGSCQIFHTLAGGGPTTVTLTRANTNGRLGLAILEYAGVEPVGALDVSASQAAAGSTTSAVTPQVTTTSADELLFAGFFDPSGTGVAPAPQAGWSRQVCAAQAEATTQDRVVSSQGSYSATAALAAPSSNWVATIAAFRLTPPPDAGTPDAGTPADAGTPVDGGTMLRPGAYRVACGCGTSSGWLPLLALVRLLLRRASVSRPS